MENEALKKIFINFHAKIVENVNPESVIEVLLSKNIISEDDYNDLRKAKHSRDRCRGLLSLLCRSSHPETFIQLRLALRDEHPVVVDQIDEQLASPTAQLQQLRLDQSIDGECPLQVYTCNSGNMQR